MIAQSSTLTLQRIAFLNELMHISRQFFTTSLLSLFSFIFLILIPHEYNPSGLFGFSPLRLMMLAGFLGISLFMGAGGLVFRRRRTFADQLWGRLEQVLKRPWLRDGLIYAACLIVSSAGYLALVGLTESDVQIRSTLLRILPGLFFAGASAVQFLNLASLQASRRRWLAAILLALLMAFADRLVSAWLLEGIDHWYPQTELLKNLRVIRPALVIVFTLLIADPASRGDDDLSTWPTVLGMASALFLLQWATLPESYWRIKPYLALSGSLLLTVWTLAARWVTKKIEAYTSRPASSGTRQSLLPKLLLTVVFLGLAALYTVTAVRHAREINTGISLSDQASYVNFAIKARELNFNYTGDHNRTPGYPFFQALFYRPGMSAGEFFAQGKEINILLSLALLGVLFLIFRRFLGTTLASLLTLIVAFSLYIFKAPYFQTEILFYSLVFAAFVLMTRLLQRPSLGLALSAGVVLGLGHLVKASILPGLGIFASVYLLKELISSIRNRRVQLSRLMLLALVIAVYLSVIFPYIHAVKARFGQYFYNVNLTFYVWYDSYLDALEAEEQYGFTQRWPSEIPPDELPGPAKYFREHTPTQILERIRDGLTEQGRNILSQFGVTNYHLSYLLVLLCAVLMAPKRAWKLVRDNPYLVLFELLYLAGYLASFTWYATVAPERRFTYTLYVPLLFSIFAALKNLANSVRVSRVITAAHLLAACSVVINIWLVVSERMFFDTYGS